MASIKQLTDRKFKITVSNGYRPNGKKICKAKTITVPNSVKPRGIRQYVAHEAEELERLVKSGFAEDRDTTFETYAARWLERQVKYAPGTLARLPADAGSTELYHRRAGDALSLFGLSFLVKSDITGFCGVIGNQAIVFLYYANRNQQICACGNKIDHHDQKRHCAGIDENKHSTSQAQHYKGCQNSR